METKPRFVDEFGGAKAVEGTVPKQFACEAYQKDFLAKLTDATVLDSERIDEIRGLLGDGKKVKAEDLVRILPRFLQAEISSDQTRIPHIEEVRGIRKLDIDFQKGTGAKPSSPRMNRLPGPCGTRGGGDKKRRRRHRDKWAFAGNPASGTNSAMMA